MAVNGGGALNCHRGRMEKDESWELRLRLGNVLLLLLLAPLEDGDTRMWSKEWAKLSCWRR